MNLTRKNEVNIMAKTVNTIHNMLKVFGIKIFDYYSDYVCNETSEDFETMRDSIILHENIIRQRDVEN